MPVPPPPTPNCEYPNAGEIIKKGVELYNKHFPNDKHITDKEKKGVVEFFIKLNEITRNNTDLVDRTIKVLKSKVNTYAADIVKQHKERPEAINLSQQSINKTK